MDNIWGCIQELCELFGTPEIDLFASRLNAKLSVYCSFQADPFSTYVDAFSIDWGRFSLSYLFPPFSTVLAGNSNGQSKKFSDSSFVANSTLVHFFNENFNPHASGASQNEENSDTSSYEFSSPIVKKVSVDSMSCVRKCFRDKGFSELATKVIMSSWRTGTKKQYQTYISRWLQYCHRKQIDSLSAALIGVIHFLTEQYEAGLGYSSLNTARGALSSLGLKFEQFAAGNHPLVTRFMTGVYNLRPTKPKYAHTWSVDLVLKYLRTLSPVKELTLRW